jgi:putative selenate reductase molybdopterin-binding subunit
MKLQLLINDVLQDVQVFPGESLLKVLRRLGYFSVKHGCETGECGACAVLLDGKPVNTCVYLAAQAQGHDIRTLESIGEHPQQGWKASRGLHPLQQAFVETGAIQCGYCTPAMILAAKELLERNPTPARPRCGRRFRESCAAAPVI